MAGHSKWANIQHRKSRQDAKRGKLFTRLIREITVAARLGGGDIESNPRLRAATDNAYSNNMNKDTIERAIERGIGSGEGNQVVEVSYEGYGSGGVAILVKCMTDNKNRTVAEVRNAFSKHGGNLGTEGSVAYLFQKMGLFTYNEEVDEDGLLEVALEVGAEDVVVDNVSATIEVISTVENFMAVKTGLVEKQYAPNNAEITLRAKTLVQIDSAKVESLLKLLNKIDELDDTQKVHSNADISVDVLASMGMA